MNTNIVMLLLSLLCVAVATGIVYLIVGGVVI